MYSYEQDPELFNFDYKEDLTTMAKERERIFSLSRFTTMADEQEEDTNNIYGLVYGHNDLDNAGGFGGINASEV